MKLYLIPCYDIEDYNYAEDSEGGNHASDMNVFSVSTHKHERYTNFSTFLQYNTFENLTFRQRYNAYEYQLIDISDDLTFQFMLLGLKDFDFIAYNHKTKKIYVGNNSYRIAGLASEPSEEEPDKANASSSTSLAGRRRAHSKHNSAYGGRSNRPSQRMFTFNSPQEEPVPYDEEDQEEVQIRIDSTNGYDEIKKELMVYMEDIYFKMFTKAAIHLRSSGRHIIGEQSNSLFSDDGYSSVYDPNAVRNANPVGYKRTNSSYDEALQLTTEEFGFLFESYWNDDELWINTQKKIHPRHKECIRAYTCDAWKKFTECETK